MGKAIEGFTITIVADDGKPAAAHAVGEIVMNSSALSCGYWLNEDATRASRCEYGLKSGDVGKMDEDGYIYIVDRKRTSSSPAGTRCGRAKWRMSCISIPPCGRRPWSASPMIIAAKRSRRW